MTFLHCHDCGATVRVLSAELRAADGPDGELGEAGFRARHRRCRTTRFAPTGRAYSSLPWHEPLAERRIEVADAAGRAVAIGSRVALDEPLHWRIEPGGVTEELSIELDRDAFLDAVDRALHPHHVPVRAVTTWTTRIERHVRRLAADDVVVLHDDTTRPNVTLACPTPTARIALEQWLESLGLDPESERRLHALFDDSQFPPLVLHRLPTRDAAS